MSSSMGENAAKAVKEPLNAYPCIADRMLKKPRIRLRGEMRRRLASTIAGSTVLILAGCGSSPSESPTVVNTPTAAQPDVRDQVSVELERCDPTEAAGTVTNDGELTVNVFIDVSFLDEDGVQVGNRIATARALAPGATAEWTSPFLGLGEYETCTARVSSVTGARE